MERNEIEILKNSKKNGMPIMSENARVITFQPKNIIRHPKNHLYVLKDTAFLNPDTSVSCPHDLSMKKPKPEETIDECFKCQNCPYITLSKNKFERHSQPHSFQPETELQCLGCSNKFISEKSYKAHLIYDHLVPIEEVELFLQINQVPQEPDLPEEITELPEVEMPKIRAKEELKLYKCLEKHCNTRMQSLANVEYHSRCHFEQEFQCLECAVKFTRWNSLRGHLWRKHKIDMELYSCDMCDYKTFSQSSLNNIHKRIHGDSKPFLCDICAKAFKNPKQLCTHKAIHKPTHKTNQFVCEICNRPFTSRRLLRLHNEGIHQQLKRFLCNYCGYKASSKSAVQLHERKHTGAKPYSCNLCDYVTGDHNSLRRHRSKHTREYAYSCPYCDYACIQSSTFKVHLKSKHPNEEDVMMFSCNFCNYKSLRRNNYLTHMAKHRGKDSLEVGVYPLIELNYGRDDDTSSRNTE